MPIPKPKAGEEKEDFMERCMSFLKKEKDKFPTHEQRVAIALSQWMKANESESVEDIIVT